MDLVSLATVTAAATTLGIECLKGAGSSAGKDLWTKVRALLGWSKDPSPEQLAHEIAQRLVQEPGLIAKVAEILQSQPSETAGQMIGVLNARKVVVAQQIHAQTFKM